jgi:ATP-dependent DNA helicase RecG
MRSFLQEIKSDLAEESTTMPFTDLCRKMQIARGSVESLRPVNVGLLFFSTEPHHFFNRAWIELVIRKDEAGRDFDEIYFKGPLHQQLRDALRYINTQIIKGKVLKIPGQAEAMRFYNYPYEAVEEALANAVYHKSYELGNPIEVQIWPDKIEILSYPGPVPPITAKILSENRRVVARDYRNRRVGDFLKELHLTEGRGTGIPSIKRSLEHNQSPEPIFETDDQCLTFLTIITVNPVFIHDQESNLVSDQVSAQESAQESTQESNKVKQVLGFCLHAKSRAEILESLGISSHFKNYKKYIEPLTSKGWLEFTHPENPKHRNQKYKTTPLGRRMVSNPDSLSGNLPATPPPNN